MVSDTPGEEGLTPCGRVVLADGPFPVECIDYWLYGGEYMTPREELILLMGMRPGKAGDDSSDQVAGAPWPEERIRPLDHFSDFVCSKLGQRNDQIRAGSLDPDVLFRESEDLMSIISTDRIAVLQLPENIRTRRVALLDLVWAERSLDVAYNRSAEYKARKRHARVFKLARILAGIERRHPVLSWSDIAIYYPSRDPRSFLGPGSLRDQEILMYRMQGSIERVFKSVIETSQVITRPVDLKQKVDDLDYALKAMIHMNKFRDVGQFYKIDPFLGANGSYRGHATGAFSVWSLVLGVLLADNAHLRSRIIDPANRMAYDRDADSYVMQIVNDEFVTLPAAVAAQAAIAGNEREEISMLLDAARTKFTLFLHSHRGAIKRHAAASFADSAPSFPSMTNSQAIKATIDGMQPKRPMV